MNKNEKFVITINRELGSGGRTGKSKDDNGTYFMFQLSCIGAEFGKQFRGFAEAGIGEQGFQLAGIRYKF